MTNISTTESLLESLNAYVKHFETPNTREDLLAIWKMKNIIGIGF